MQPKQIAVAIKLLICGAILGLLPLGGIPIALHCLERSALSLRQFVVVLDICLVMDIIALGTVLAGLGCLVAIYLRKKPGERI